MWPSWRPLTLSFTERPSGEGVAAVICGVVWSTLGLPYFS